MRWYAAVGIFLVVSVLLAVPYLSSLQDYSDLVPNTPVPIEPIENLRRSLQILTNLQKFIWSIPEWKRYLIVLWFLLFGAFSYLVRCRLRIIYGVIEICASVYFVNLALSDVAGSASSLATDMLSLAGGIYVAVRALDNIENGLRADFPRVHQRWRFFFFGDPIPPT